MTPMSSEVVKLGMDDLDEIEIDPGNGCEASSPGRLRMNRSSTADVGSDIAAAAHFRCPPLAKLQAFIRLRVQFTWIKSPLLPKSAAPVIML